MSVTASSASDSRVLGDDSTLAPIDFRKDHQTNGNDLVFVV